MRSLLVTNTAIDLAAQVEPFIPNNSVVVLNVTAGNLVLQESDASGSGFTTLATCVPGANNVTLNKQYVKVSTAANLFLLGN